MEGSPKEPTIPDALAAIMMVEQRMQAEGAMDSEKDALNQLRAAVTEGKMEPRHAIERAQAMAESRQNYH